MKRSSFESMNCSLARSLEIVGEWWTLLVIRELMWGTTRFDDFHSRLGIARNILAVRLTKLESFGVLERHATAQSARVFEYRLTEKGWGLFPTVVALMQWGDRWVHTDEGPPIDFFDAAECKPIQPIAVRNVHGIALRPTEVDVRPGRGAIESTILRAMIAKKTAAKP